ncbi:hypothetical protein HDU67_008945 [Dinochytrium kinnereticum]|nr:hypothetical protein HDU67_008945 [Dinochytrium kinnereticum]
MGKEHEVFKEQEGKDIQRLKGIKVLARPQRSGHRILPLQSAADTCSNISAEGLEKAGPHYVCHPPLPFHCVMEEVDGELWPAGYPRYLCQWGPAQVVVPLLCREANYNVVFVPILAYQAIFNAGDVYLPMY